MAFSVVNYLQVWCVSSQADFNEECYSFVVFLRAHQQMQWSVLHLVLSMIASLISAIGICLFHVGHEAMSKSRNPFHDTSTSAVTSTAFEVELYTRMPSQHLDSSDAGGMKEFSEAKSQKRSYQIVRIIPCTIRSRCWLAVRFRKMMDTKVLPGHCPAL